MIPISYGATTISSTYYTGYPAHVNDRIGMFFETNAPSSTLKYFYNIKFNIKCIHKLRVSDKTSIGRTMSQQHHQNKY
ncbi:MAG: hypothetical protein QM731_03320 [Chitinophagaceae bacterium]